MDLVRRRGLAPSILLGVLLTGCGPSTDQLAATALASAPIAYALALLGVWALYGLWRERIGSVEPRWGLAAVYALALIAVAMITTQGQRVEAEVFAIAAFLCAATCVAGSMLLARLGLRRLRASHDYGLTLTVMPALVTAAVYLMFLLTWLIDGEAEELAFTIGLALVGVGGTYVAGPLILGLIVETVFARTRSPGSSF